MRAQADETSGFSVEKNPSLNRVRDALANFFHTGICPAPASLRNADPASSTIHRLSHKPLQLAEMPLLFAANPNAILSNSQAVAVNNTP
jgi:hypothetical protein